MLGRALEAGCNCTPGTRRALADAERSLRQLTLSTGLGADGGRVAGKRARVAGHENESCEGTAERGKGRDVESTSDHHAFRLIRRLMDRPRPEENHRTCR